MKITRESDYALRIMRSLAIKDGLTDAKTLSEETAVPLRFTVKILNKLVGGGVVRSRKGAAGGYALNGEPGEITMRSVIEITEGPLVISRCLENDFKCEQDGCKNHCSCFYNRVFDEINVLIAKKLESITLLDVIRETNGENK